jgi:hypothetical protein
LRLGLLVAGTTLPLILFAGGLVYLNHAHDRAAAADRVLEAVRSIRPVLDREMQGITSGLQVLALSPALRRNDFEGFRTEVESFRSQYLPSMALSLAEPGAAQQSQGFWIAADRAELCHPARRPRQYRIQPGLRRVRARVPATVAIRRCAIRSLRRRGSAAKAEW